MKSFIRSIGQTFFLALAIAFLFSASARADDGAAVFNAKCATCHGPDGSGSTPAGKAMKARDFSSPEVQSQSDAQLAEIVTNGKNKMPAYKGKLTDAQIKDLVAYIRTLGKKK